MAQKQIAISLRQLCSDPDSQSYIVREKQCMQGLMDLLAPDDDPEVLLITLQALSFLSSNPLNREPLVQSYPQLVVRLVSLSTSSDDTMIRVTPLANTILEHLESYINQDDNKKHKQPTRRQTMAPGTGRNIDLDGRRRGSSFTPKYQHEIILRINDMISERQRNDVERVLIDVRGVTSVTINMTNKQVTVYTGLSEERISPLLLSAVATIGLEATPYRTSIAGSTSNPTSRRTSVGYINDENATPSYLNSHASTPSQNTITKPTYRTKETTSAPTVTPTPTPNVTPSYANPSSTTTTTPSYVNPASAYYGAVTPHQGFEDSTLKARYAAKNKVEETKKVQESRVKSLFGSVASYFW